MIENSHLQRVNIVCETSALLDEGAGVNIKGREGGEMFVIVVVVVLCSDHVRSLQVCLEVDLEHFVPKSPS